MKKLIIIIIFLVSILSLSGCLNKSTTVQKKHEYINFKSDVLQLVNSSVDVKEENNVIYKVEANLRFKNIYSERINVTYTVNFCDKDDNKLYGRSFTIENMPAGYVESYGNNFVFSEDNVNNFDHININVIDYEIVK